MLNWEFRSLAQLCFHSRDCLLYSEEVATLNFNIFSLQTASFIRHNGHIILFKY